MPPIRRPEERIGRTLARLAPGTLGGTLPGAARPVTPVGELRTAPGGGIEHETFHHFATLSVVESDEYPVPGPVQLLVVRARLTTASTSGSVTAEFRGNGTAVGSAFSWAASTAGDATDLTTFTTAEFGEGDYWTVAITAAGTGAAGLVIVPEWVRL
jgi:hypothetical protein